MIKSNRKLLIFLSILIVLLPLGIIVPHMMRSGEAWGEWSVSTIKEKTGQSPEGMKSDAEIYHAPISGYEGQSENRPLAKRSIHYIISGLIGTAIILILTFGITKFTSRKPE